MKHLSWWLRCLIPALAVVVVAAGCGSTTGSSTSGNTASSYQIKAMSKSVKGKQESVLTDAQGQTLYYYLPDKAQMVTCTGACAKVWPALKLPAKDSKATGGSGVSGSFGTDPDPSGGKVITYNGWPLYTFSGDKGMSDANGEGVGGVWFVATPSLQKGAAAPTPTPAPSSGSGYGGGY